MFVGWHASSGVMKCLFDYWFQASFPVESGNFCVKMVLYVSVSCVNFLRQLEPECEKGNFDPEYDLVGSESHFYFSATHCTIIIPSLRPCRTNSTCPSHRKLRDTLATRESAGSVCICACVCVSVFIYV